MLCRSPVLAYKDVCLIINWWRVVKFGPGGGRGEAEAEERKVGKERLPVFQMLAQNVLVRLVISLQGGQLFEKIRFVPFLMKRGWRSQLTITSFLSASVIIWLVGRTLCTADVRGRVYLFLTWTPIRRRAISRNFEDGGSSLRSSIPQNRPTLFCLAFLFCLK